MALLIPYIVCIGLNYPDFQHVYTLSSNHKKITTFADVFQCLQEISVIDHKKMNAKNWHLFGTPTGICIHVGKTGSRVKALVETEIDERTGLHQEDRSQRSS